LQDNKFLLALTWQWNSALLPITGYRCPISAVKEIDTKGKVMNQEHQTVHITIDRKPKVSPNPTTGTALYALGEVRDGYDLFREVHGHGDDELIPKNANAVHLKEGDHFYSAQSKLNPGGR
jgi:hypothetical protein